METELMKGGIRDVYFKMDKSKEKRYTIIY